MKTTAIQTLQDQDVIITDGYTPFEKCISPELYDTMEIQDEISDQQIFDASTGITKVCKSSISAFYYKAGEFGGFATHSDTYELEGCHNRDILQALISF